MGSSFSILTKYFYYIRGFDVAKQCGSPVITCPSMGTT